MTRFYVSFVVRSEWIPDESLDEPYYVEAHERRYTSELCIPVQARSAEEAIGVLEKKLEDLCK